MTTLLDHMRKMRINKVVIRAFPYLTTRGHESLKYAFGRGAIYLCKWQSASISIIGIRSCSRLVGTCVRYQEYEF
jgi:hypothetical protein